MKIFPAENQITDLHQCAIDNGISVEALLARCDAPFCATLTLSGPPAERLLQALRELDRVGQLADGSVPMVGLLAELAYQLRFRKSRDLTMVHALLRFASQHVPEDARKLHEERGDFDALTKESSPPPPPPPPPRRPVTRGTVAALGAFSAVLAWVMMTLFPRAWGGLLDDVTCYTGTLAAVPAGGFTALVLFGLTEQLRNPERAGARRWLVWGAALLGGAELPLVAHLFATAPYTSGPSLDAPFLCAAGAGGALALVSGGSLGRPRALLVSVWPGTITAVGTLTGYAVCSVVVILNPWSPGSTAEMLAPVRHAPMVASVALIFVAVTDAVLAVRVRGSLAVQGLPVDPAGTPEHAVVAPGLLAKILVGSSVLAVAFLSHAFLSRP
jgi:hypothetical protein